jgi:leucyl-tRNA synthetase
MMGKYDHRAIERKWSHYWEQNKTHATDIHAAKRPYYNLMMFPYPSAEGLHVGNVFAFTGSDVHGRFIRAQGHDVFEPIGFDAFGIHSENYALKVGQHPMDLVPKNIDRFRERQLKRLGAMFDWSRQITTTDPKYYRWTQWIFIKLYEAGLAYQKDASVNWCPSCKTVLADEQADGGCCERCNTTIERRTMRQWFFRITAYAQKLLDNLDWIDWSKTVTTAQRNWIGRSEGVTIHFAVAGRDERITVFTTRVDTLWGVTYLALAPEHSAVEHITTPEQAGRVKHYIEGCIRKRHISPEARDKEKSGVFTGAYAIHPTTNRKIPIWISNYILTTHGTGAIMGVPGHDTRDFEFAEQFTLPIVQVIRPDGGAEKSDEAYTGDGQLINSGPFNGLFNRDAIGRISEFLTTKGKGESAVSYRLHDWCISRQRYWGPPIPMIHCDACGVVPVPESHLPVLLPYLQNFQPDGSGLSPLARNGRFVHTTCPICNHSARRETDVSDNFLDSAWYFFRYPSSDRDNAIFDSDVTKKWLPVDMYIGGQEHAVLHLLYARFITMAFKDTGLIDFEEPFGRFRAHGLLTKDGAKMSKSKGNVVNPDRYVDEFGADTFRTYLMFLGPFTESGEFRDTGINGIRRFYDRLWCYVTETQFLENQPADRPVLEHLHKTIQKVTECLQDLRYNTAIAAIMEFFNYVTGQPNHFKDYARVLLQLVAPFALFLAQELWQHLGERGMICQAPWPQYDPELLQAQTIEFVVQVDGKVRDRLTIIPGTSQKELEVIILNRPRVREYTGSKHIVRHIFVPDKLMNLVTHG